MSNYNNFSPFYDLLTYDVNYKKRAEYLINIFKEKDRCPSLLLDFACGTGNFSVEFSKMGIEVIGVDMSEGMLCEARDKNEELETPVLYLCQKGSELDLFGTVDGAVSCLDSLNHITDYGELKETIKKISLFLEPERLFVFDMNTPYKHKEILGNSFYKTKKRGVTCYWTNRLLKDDVTVEITLDITYKTGFLKKETVREIIKERAYTDDEIKEALIEAGFTLEAVYGENTLLPPKEDTQRNIYVARKVK